MMLPPHCDKSTSAAMHGKLEAEDRVAGKAEIAAGIASGKAGLQSGETRASSLSQRGVICWKQSGDLLDPI